MGKEEEEGTECDDGEAVIKAAWGNELKRKRRLGKRTTKNKMNKRRGGLVGKEKEETVG